MIYAYCNKHLSPKRRLGFLQTVWRPTLKEFRRNHRHAIRLVGEAIHNEK